MKVMLAKSGRLVKPEMVEPPREKRPQGQKWGHFGAGGGQAMHASRPIQKRITFTPCQGAQMQVSPCLSASPVNGNAQHLPRPSLLVCSRPGCKGRNRVADLGSTLLNVGLRLTSLTQPPTTSYNCALYIVFTSFP